MTITGDTISHKLWDSILCALAQLSPLAILTLLPSVAISETSPNQSVVLPAIISHWRTEEDKGKPEITIDEIGKCMGVNSGSQALYESVKTDNPIIERERSAIDSRLEGIERSRSEVAVTEAKLAAEKKALEEKEAEFTQRSNELKKIQGAKLTPEEATRANAAIVLFNKDLVVYKKNVASYNLVLTSHRKKIDALNARILESNEYAKAFNERVAEFNSRAERLTRLIAQYNDRCVGERRLVK